MVNVVAYVKLYAAMIQMAGFALHKKYGSQFMKILDVISRRFIPALKEQGVKVQAEAISSLQNYLNDKVYLEEPEGRYLAQHLLSKVFICEDEHRMATSAPVSSRE